MVIKPSGFSQTAWGSRGVVIGHDVSGDEWREAVDKALRSFASTTSILQAYIAPDQIEMVAFDRSGNSVERIEGRVVRMSFCHYDTRDNYGDHSQAQWPLACES